jgi:hypothetical protein
MPPDYISDTGIRKFLTNLKIPAYSSGRPSLLFHNLEYEGDDKGVDEIFGGGRPRKLHILRAP